MKFGINKRAAAAATIGACCLVVGAASAQKQPREYRPLTDLEQLGRHVFFDERFSVPEGQACASCHDPAVGFVFPDPAVNFGQVGAPGAVEGAVGTIKTPSNAYASFAPAFLPCSEVYGGNRGAPPGGRHCGGMFWDGRAEGHGRMGANPRGDGALSETITADYLPPSVREAYSVFLGPVADQALNPFPNPAEQNIEEIRVCKRVLKGWEAVLYKNAFGEWPKCGVNPAHNPRYKQTFRRLAVALSAFQASPEVNSFTSRRDIALRKELACKEPNGDFGFYHDFYPNFGDWCANTLASEKPDMETWGKFPLVELTDLENQGHDLFYDVPSELNPPQPVFDEAGEPVIDPDTGEQLVAASESGCHRCHNDNPLVEDGSEPYQTYNDQAYHNIGIPFNPEIPGVLPGQIEGVSAHLTSAQPGFFKNPTIRNVGKGDGGINGKRKAFGHNGYFKSLEQIVHFYSTRDLKESCDYPRTDQPRGINVAVRAEPIYNATAEQAIAANCWPIPEFPDGVSNFGGVGILNLTENEEAAVVAYLRAMSDQYTTPPPPRSK